MITFEVNTSFLGFVFYKTHNKSVNWGHMYTGTPIRNTMMGMVLEWKWTGAGMECCYTIDSSVDSSVDSN